MLMFTPKNARGINIYEPKCMFLFCMYFYLFFKVLFEIPSNLDKRNFFAISGLAIGSKTTAAVGLFFPDDRRFLNPPTCCGKDFVDRNDFILALKFLAFAS